MENKKTNNFKKMRVGKIRTEKKSFLINGKIYTKFFPQIIINGKVAHILDKNTPTGLKECDTREQAQKEARAERENLIERGHIDG